MYPKTYVIDTSVYLTDHTSINNFGKSDIIVPLKVLEEIDKHKKRQDSVGNNARSIIRTFDSLREGGSLQEGVSLGDKRGNLYVKGYDSRHIPDDLDRKNADHIIIATALTLREQEPERDVILVTRDIQLRVICDSLGLACEGYSSDQVVETAEGLYDGLTEFYVEDRIIEDFYAKQPIFVDDVLTGGIPLHNNQFIMMKSDFDDKKTALAFFEWYDKPVRHITDIKGGIWGVIPRNKEQRFALDMLMNPNIPLVSIVGKAGCGKSLLCLAAGLEQVLAADSTYKRLIVARPIQPMGKDIGFLPGDLNDKLLPWLMPIQDNLQFLMGDDKAALELYVEKGTIEIEALTYIRGRSISNAYILIDEAQNLSAHEIKTIITRVGENTKIVFTGDIDQIDNVYVDATSNGLSYVVEKMKDQEVAGHITLKKGERSLLASIASKIL
jgi:PhoH-like ATPase